MGPRQYRRRKSAGGRSGPPGRGGPGAGSLAASSCGRAAVGVSIPDAAPNGSGSSSDGDLRAWPGPARAVDGGARSGWSSRSAVRTGRLRRSPAVHSRPIDLVVSQEPSDAARHGNLVLKRASRLDAFSAYPFPTWLPGDAPSGTAGTPEVGPPQSSRTRGDPSQVSSAHGR